MHWRGAQAALGETQGQRATARAQDESLQRKLTETEAALKVSIAKLKKGAAQLAESEATVEQFTVESLQQGDRGMRAFSGLLRGEDPSTFSEQMSLNNSVSDAQIATMQTSRRPRSSSSSSARRSRRCATGREAAQAGGGQPRQEAARGSAARRPMSVTSSCRAKARARNPQTGPQDDRRVPQVESERRPLNAQLGALAAKERKKGGEQQSGGDNGGRCPTRSTADHLALRDALHPVTGVYKLHDGTDFGVGCGTPVARPRRHDHQQYYNSAYGNRVIVEQRRQAGQSLVTTYNHLTRVTAAAAARSNAARSSATSAAPVTPPAATCTSWTIEDGHRRTRWAGCSLNRCHKSPGARWWPRTRRRATTTTSRTPSRPASC